MPELIRLMFRTACEEVVVSLFMLRLLNGRGFFFICSPETRPGFPAGLIIVLFRFDAITREYLSGYNILALNSDENEAHNSDKNDCFQRIGNFRKGHIPVIGRNNKYLKSQGNLEYVIRPTLVTINL